MVSQFTRPNLTDNGMSPIWRHKICKCQLISIDFLLPTGPNTVHQPAAMRYDIMTKNKEKKGLRRGMENGGKKNDFFVTSAKLHIPLSWKFSLSEFLTRVHTTLTEQILNHGFSICWIRGYLIIFRLIWYGILTKSTLTSLKSAAIGSKN